MIKIATPMSSSPLRYEGGSAIDGYFDSVLESGLGAVATLRSFALKAASSSSHSSSRARSSKVLCDSACCARFFVFMPERLIVFCDESVVKGPFYSHFYGGALVRAEDREDLEREIKAKKAELNLSGEVKWTKITENYADKYVQLVDFIFDLIDSGRLKIRIMFTQNMHVPPEFDDEKIDNQYFLLYYQFLKHAFGLRYWRQGDNFETAEVSVYIDDPPQTGKKFSGFADYIASLSANPIFSQGGVSFPRSEIAKINSHNHSILQAVDIILGGIQSRLNEVHTKVVPPARRRSKRARAKEKVYKRIQQRIWCLYPNFNVGISTGHVNVSDRWLHPYRHWNLRAHGSTIDRSRGKKAKAPPGAT